MNEGRLRAYRGVADHASMLEVLNQCHQAAGSPQRISPESFEFELGQDHSADLDANVVVVELGGAVVGYARVAAAHSSHGPAAYTTACYLLPSARRRGIGRRLMGYTEQRVRELAVSRGDAGPRIHAEPFDTDPGARRLLLGAGYRPVRHFYTMVRAQLTEIPEASLPLGFEVRMVQPGHLRTIWEADVEAFRDHWIRRDERDHAYSRFVADPLNDFGLWRVAWLGDQVVGQVRSYINQYENKLVGVRRGWTENISVRRPWRRVGLARALLIDSMRALRDRGMTSAALGADSAGGAVALYHDLGFEAVASTTVYEKQFA